MVLKRIGPFSLAKIMGIIYAVLGLLMGFIISGIALITISPGSALGKSAGSLVGSIFGVGAIIVMPILYGAGGFLGGFIMAVIYNWVSRWVGGIEINLEETSIEI
ncbi:MAG: hypothetical protein V3W18_01595 [candidate division Zixibacteria bacterium]